MLLSEKSYAMLQMFKAIIILVVFLTNYERKEVSFSGGVILIRILLLKITYVTKK